MGYKRKEYENMESLFTNGKKKFVKYEEGAAMYSMGIHAFTELAKEAKAIGEYGDHRRVYRELQRHLMEQYGNKIRCTAFKKTLNFCGALNIM